MASKSIRSTQRGGIRTFQTTGMELAFPPGTPNNFYILVTGPLEIIASNLVKNDYSLAATWVRTPSYRQLKKLGQLPVNPYTYVKDEISNGNGIIIYSEGSIQAHNFYKTVEAGTFETFRLGTIDTSIPGGKSSDDIANTLLANVQASLLEKAKDVKTNILQVVAEREQTISLVASIASKIGTAALQIRRAQFTAAGKTLGLSATTVKGAKSEWKFFSGNDPRVKELSNQWLSLQYGWKPLLSDVYGICEELANRENTMKAVKVKSTKKQHDEAYTISYSTGLVTFKHYVTDISVKGGFSLSAGPAHKLSKLGLTNPLYIGWELLPWSFVIDWFLPVGQFLNNLDAAWFQEASKGYLAVSKVETLSQLRIRNFDSNGVIIIGSDYSSSKYTRITRNPFSGFPAPAWPKWKNPVSELHIYNALALGYQAFGRH